MKAQELQIFIEYDNEVEGKIQVTKYNSKKGEYKYMRIVQETQVDPFSNRMQP